MPAAAFINPAFKRVEDDDKDDLQYVAKQVAYSQEKTLTDPEEVKQMIQPVKIADALTSLTTLRLYKEQQEYRSRELVRSLNRFEREIRGRQASRSTQRTLDAFLTANQSN
jgi:hypothetical protein